MDLMKVTCKKEPLMPGISLAAPLVVKRERIESRRVKQETSTAVKLRRTPPGIFFSQIANAATLSPSSWMTCATQESAMNRCVCVGARIRILP